MRHGWTAKRGPTYADRLVVMFGPSLRRCYACCSVRGGDDAGDALHAPSLRLRLLRSLAALIAAAKVPAAPTACQSTANFALSFECFFDDCLLASILHRPILLAQDKLLDRAPGAAFGGYRGGRREAGLLAAACEAYAGGWV